MTKRSILAFSWIVVAWVSPLSALAQPDDRFAIANREYSSNHFKEAIQQYEAMVHEGQWSANLFYDLGNAYFREGDLGRAILSYERALALQPGHPEAQANLRLVRDEARALEMQKSLPERYLHSATANQFAIAAAVAFWLGAYGLAASIFSRGRSGRLVALTSFSFIACALFFACVFWIETGSQGRGGAIVTSSGVEARVATADNANSVLALPPGSQIKILSQRGDWLYAALPNNLRGWIPAKSAEQVRL